MNRLDLTGILPTFGRYDLLLERAGAIAEYPFPVLVLDGHRDPDPGKVAAVKAIPNVEYRHFPDAHTNERYQAVLGELDTAYVLPLADDDVVLPDVVAECVAFLDANTEYAACQGSFWIKNTESSGGPFGPYLLESHFPSLEQDDLVQRLTFHGRQYAHTFYGVQRLGAFKVCIDNTDPLLGMGAFCELARSFTLVGMGKVKCFGEPMGLRSPTPREDLEAKPIMHPLLWMRHDRAAYDEAVERFVSALASRAPFRDSRATVEGAYEAYLSGATDASENITQENKYLIRVMDRVLDSDSTLQRLTAMDPKQRHGLHALEQALKAFVTASPDWGPANRSGQ